MEDEKPQASTSESGKPGPPGSTAISQVSLGEEQSEPFLQPTCNSCQEEIGGEYLVANGFSWHRQHFTCEQCNEPITEFAVQDGHYYCKDDYFKLFGATCKECGKIITEPYITAMDSFWHRDHWTCASCKQKLELNEFYEVDSRPYCRDCYAKEFCPICPTCALPIIGERIIALSKRYHVECLKCEGCNKVIGRDQYFIQNRQFYCSDCAKKLFDNE